MKTPIEEAKAYVEACRREMDRIQEEVYDAENDWILAKHELEVLIKAERAAGVPTGRDEHPNQAEMGLT